MWYIVLLLFGLPVYADGSLMDQMSETMELCCNQGTAFARNHTSDDCSSSVPPDVPSTFASMCVFAMDQCCKEFVKKKADCEYGIEIATSAKTCASTKESVKKCCDQCKSGTKVAKANGINSCAVSVEGKSDEQLLASDAFSQCCKSAARDASSTSRSKPNPAPVSNPPDKVLSSLPSVCEDYAPNELCAHHCIPIPGSYKCECNPGFMLMPDGRNCKEVTKNRCKPHNPCQHKCNDNGVEVKCSCRRGYQLMSDGKSCEDIDECILDPPVCLPNTQCHNIQGSYKCIPIKHPKNNLEKGQCPPGFAKNLLNNACDDINECKLPKPPCPSYLCENTMGAYKCGGVSGDPANFGNKPKPVEDRCPPGFRNGINEECEDVDECLLGHDDCNKQSQFCINTRGSFHCQDKGSKHCPPGFKTNALTNKCEDIDECEDGQDICRPDQICVNVLGEYDCKPKLDLRKSNTKCPDGMRLNPDTKICDDIDECVEGTHLCDPYQNCLNTNGSHECHCKLGFELDSTIGACVDINECATEQNNCIPESQRCDNTVGSFLCIRLLSCGTGYIIHHSSSTCEDIDECTLGTHNCDRAGPQYQCVNIPGSFRCQKRVTTTPVPEYEYEYYDSEEEIEVSPNTTVSDVITTTIPTSTAILPALPDERKVGSEEKDINNPAIPGLVEKTENTLDNDIITNAIDVSEQPEPAFRELNRSNEFIPIEPTVSKPEKTKPYDFGPRFEPTESTKTQPTEKENTRVVSEVTNVPEVVTSPKLVILNAGEETATVKGKKLDDGSVVVDTKEMPKNEWTIINEKPTECQPGFEIDSFGFCFDIDECATNRHSCSGLTEICRNTMGGYLCDCAYGFRRVLATGACTLITTSSTTSTSTTTTPSTTTSTTSTTTTTPAPTTSSTQNYYWGYPDQRITSRPFKPRSNCDVGYYMNSKTGKCEDINECTNGQATCASVEICVNTEGGYRCECSPNWTFDPHRNRCVQVWGAGKFPPGYGNIPDVDECATGEALCGPLQVCTNLPGGYTCSCPAGHKLVGDHVCEDVDECALGGSIPICSQNADCINTVGSYQCRCHQGFKTAPVNDKVCVDVDECTDSRPGTLCQHRCNNVWGGYRCSCHRGYRLNLTDNRTCTDVDECTEFKHKNLCIGRCLNEPGSYRCSCPSGYRLSEDKRSCIDIDECETGEAPCATGGQYGGSSVVCLNTRGGYRCQRITCPPGYKLESRHRCTKIQTYCPPADWACSHQPSTYSYNYITFVSNLYIPESKVDLFTMKGPSWPYAKMKFELRVVDVDAPPSVKEKADINAFLLIQTGNQAVMSLVRPLEGPQSIELELSMELYSRGQFGGIAVAKLYIYVSEYEF
ncbi:unnamed protein product, partial [Brenthis ino]